MPLQIRRGLEADRLSITPLAGELLFVTDTGKLFVGDGSTAGGINPFIIAANSITVNELQPTSWTAGQVLAVDVSGDLYFKDDVVGTIGENSVGITELNVADGTSGQVLSTDGSGNLSFITIDTTIADGSITSVKIQDQAIIATKLSATGGTAGQVLSINGAGGLEWVDQSASTITENSVGVTELNVTAGTDGQALAIDGLGNLQFIDVLSEIADDSITSAKIQDQAVIATKLSATGGTAGQVLSINGAGGLEWTDVLSSVLSTNIDLNNNAITGNGNIDITGTLKGINLEVGNFVNSFLIPGTDSIYDLGLNTNRWRGGYFSGLSVDGHIDALSITTDILGADSSVAFNSTTGTFTGDLTGDVTGNLTGNVFGDVTGNVTGNLSGNVTGNVTGTVFGTVIGTLDGDVVGSVFNDASGLVIDGQFGDVYPRKIISSGLLRLESPLAATTHFVTMESKDQFTSLALLRTSESDISGSNLRYGQIRFGRDDSIGRVDTNIISANRDFIWIANSPSGTVTDDKLLTVSDGKVGIGTSTPATTLDVRGPIMPGVYADATARDTAIPTPIAGMMVYLTSTNKHQGYNGTTWNDFY